MSDAWVTDDDLRAACQRFAAQIAGFVLPAAYTVARRDASGLTFGHVNGFGAVRPLPAVVLASVCGYAATTGVFAMSRAMSCWRCTFVVIAVPRWPTAARR